MTMIKIEQAPGTSHANPADHAALDAWDHCQAGQAELAMLEDLRRERGLPGVEQRSTSATLPEGLLRRVLEYIERNLDSKLKWEELAAAVGLDSFRFARGFKRATGMTPHRYVMATRVQRAMELLGAEGTSIANVALAVGCSCQSHLTTLFRMHTGTTPAAFRRAARDSPPRVGSYG
jgi:transcriptional regulator GlxA family with amidase domain